MPIDRDVENYLEAQRASGGRAVSEMSVIEARTSYEAGSPMLMGRPEEIAFVRDFELPGQAGQIHARAYRPKGSGPFPILVYFHGGGLVLGSIATHDGIARAIARRTPCVVVSIEYRLGPEHPFPAPLEDALTATNWVACNGAPGSDGDRHLLAVGGDSAGGSLAAAVALQCRGWLHPPLSLQLLAYPVLDHTLATKSWREYAEGFGLTRTAMEWYQRHGFSNLADASGSDASPLRSTDVRDAPRAAILTCEYDPLRDEGESYAQILLGAGVEVQYKCFDGLIHGAMRMPGVIRRANDMLSFASGALRDAFRRSRDIRQSPSQAETRVD